MMMNQGWICLIALLFAFSAKASVIAIIDSGTDEQHEWLSSNLWVNAGEVAGNARDDDGNLYPDDVWGWNFAENNNLLIDRQYLSVYKNEDVFKFFAIQKKLISGTATPEDIAWMQAARTNKKLLADLQIFGNFVHGTHVAGISARLDEQSQVMGLKIIPTKVLSVLNVSRKENGAFRAALTALAGQSSASLLPVGDYVNKMQAEVANGSFGVGPTQAANIVTLAFQVTHFRKPKPEELKEGIVFFLEQVLLGQKAFVAKAPNTLFVFAAGNDGMNNDEYPTAPSSLNQENTISVAATLSDMKLASFSNYGIKRVDVAAPGVGIYSSIPGGRFLEVSGTSQAAPYVAGVAAKLKEIRPELTPSELKKILIMTVDKKEFLQAKIISGGMVNIARAAQAAQNLNNGSSSVEVACARARTQVQDQKYVKSNYVVQDELIRPLELTNLFQ
jgi:subtilisin family serine protease